MDKYFSRQNSNYETSNTNRHKRADILYSRTSKDKLKEDCNYRNANELIDDAKTLDKNKRVNLYKQYFYKNSEEYKKVGISIGKEEKELNLKINQLKEEFEKKERELSSYNFNLIRDYNSPIQKKEIAEKNLWTSLQLLDDLYKQVLEMRRDNQQKTLEVMKKQETSFSAIQEMNPELAKMLKGIDDLFKPLTCYGKILECKERIQKLEKLQELAEKDPDVKAYLSLQDLSGTQAIEASHKRQSLFYCPSVQNFIYLSDEMNCPYSTKKTIGSRLTNSKKELEGYEKDRESAEKAHGGIITLDEKEFTELMNNCKEFLEQYEARVESVKKEYTDWLRNFSTAPLSGGDPPLIRAQDFGKIERIDKIMQNYRHFEATDQKLADLSKLNSKAHHTTNSIQLLHVYIRELVAASDKVSAYFLGTRFTRSSPDHSKTLQYCIINLYKYLSYSHQEQAKWFSDQQKKLTEEIKNLESRISQLSPSWKKELGQHEMTLKGQNKMIEEQGEGTSKYLEIGMHQDNDKALIKAKADKISEEWYKGLFGEPEEVRGEDREL